MESPKHISSELPERSWKHILTWKSTNFSFVSIQEKKNSYTNEYWCLQLEITLWSVRQFFPASLFILITLKNEHSELLGPGTTSYYQWLQNEKRACWHICSICGGKQGLCFCFMWILMKAIYLVSANPMPLFMNQSSDLLHKKEWVSLVLRTNLWFVAGNQQPENKLINYH